MKALTLTQPWATLIALGAKTIETRSWATTYRGPLAIHAALGIASIGGVKGLIHLCQSEPFRSVLTAADCLRVADLPRGAIVATCMLVGCRPTKGPQNENGGGPKYAAWVHALSDQERAFGDYTPGRFAWLLADIRALPEPIPARGALGFWEWEATA